MAATSGSRSLRSHPTLTLPYFAGEGTHPGECEIHGADALELAPFALMPCMQHREALHGSTGFCQPYL